MSTRGWWGLGLAATLLTAGSCGRKGLGSSAATGDDAGTSLDAKAATDSSPATTRWFVYAASENLGPGSSIHTQLFAVNLDAPNAPRLTISGADDRTVYGFAFSPDRRRVVYGLRGLANDRLGIYLVDFSSGQPGPSVVVDDQVGTGTNDDLAWSTDGRRLAYATWPAAPSTSWVLKVVDLSGAVPGPPLAVLEVPQGSRNSIRWINEDLLAYQPVYPPLPLRFVSRTPAGAWVPTVLDASVVRLFYVDARLHPPAALVTEGCSGAFIDFAAARMRVVSHGIIAAEGLSWVAERTPDGTWSIFPGAGGEQPAVATLTGGYPDPDRPRCDTGVWSHHGATLAWIDASYAVRLTSFDAGGRPTTLTLGGGYKQADVVQFSPDDRWLFMHGAYYQNPALARLHGGVADDAQPILPPDPGLGTNLLVEDVNFQRDGSFLFFVVRDALTYARAIYRASLGATAVGQPQVVLQLPSSDQSVRYTVSRDGRTLIYISTVWMGSLPLSRYFAVDLDNPELPPQPLIPGSDCRGPPVECSDRDGWEVLP